MTGSVWERSRVEGLVKTSKTVASVLRGLGLHVSSGNYRTFYRYRGVWGLDTFHFIGSKEGRKTALVGSIKIPLEEILVENSTYSSAGGSLKRRLLRSGLLEYKCSLCGISTWMGNTLSLQIDHKNGKHSDNRLENLRLLCPNCHSQTDTYAGKSKRRIRCACVECGQVLKNRKASRCRSCASKVDKDTKIEWPSKEALQTMVWSKPMTHLSGELGVSDRAIRKRCMKLSVPVPPKGYWLYRCKRVPIKISKEDREALLRLDRVSRELCQDPKPIGGNPPE